ncbi:MAG: phospho-sugar mutase [Puniceicoccales bacterium]|jgi:phosphoglucomutase|nr:phospho-sugar mutase [Puniceicoccales bacterium]
MEKFLGDRVLPAAAENLLRMHRCENFPRCARESIDELVENGLADEINNRFFKSIEFGTGGMRSRTIAEVITAAERGTSSTNCPQMAAVGTVYFNDFSVIGATMALFRYCSLFLKNNHRAHQLPTVVIAHDVRHFSRHFCELAASTWECLGGHALIYASPRSTPQLSFSVRHLRCTAGIMITASHNPWHDNGFKAYFSDGAQMVDVHANGVTAEFSRITIDEICKFCRKDMSGVHVLGGEIDAHYVNAIGETVLRRDILEKNSVRAVFSPLHGTGSIATIPALRAHGIDCVVVEKQNDGDPNFSTVKSPNPENGEALEMSIALAGEVSADIVIATDPDGDRLAVAAKNSGGQFEIFSGNVTGALLAEYRISQLKFLEKIPRHGSKNAAIVKTFVTTPLIDKIASSHGLKCINTLTGFKWIGEKMLAYENEMLEKEYSATGIAVDYDGTSVGTRDALLMRHSTLFIFGCEESYGCLAANNVRDKDANSACLMVCEMAAYAKSIGKTLCDLRDDMYAKRGYFGEMVLNIYCEGADGARKIKNILADYQRHPPASVNGSEVAEIVDFSRQKICDADGKVIPPQQFFFITLGNGVKFAVRASGTEPKIKFYLFGEMPISDASALEDAKEKTKSLLEQVKEFLRIDAHRRANFTA